MKQFILKNIALVAILALTFIGSIVLIFLIAGKSRTISQSMMQIDEDVNKLIEINNQENPRSVKVNEERIKSDTAKLDKKIAELYRHLGKPYRPALLQFLANIASTAELKTELPIDTRLLELQPMSAEAEEQAEDEDGAQEAEAAAPTEEEKEAEKKIFDPQTGRVVLAFDENKLHEMLEEIYKADHEQEEASSEESSDTHTIPENIREERIKNFRDLFEKMIEPPEAVTPANREAFREAAAKKFAHAFAIFRNDVDELTVEDVTDDVAYEIFLDAIGIPREMRPVACRSYLETITRKYLNSELIPGLPEDDQTEKQRLIQKFIYGSRDPKAMPDARDVISIIRNIQIKEDLFRRMKEAGITSLEDMTASQATEVPGDNESRLLVYAYDLKMTVSMEAIDAFINSLHHAYDSDRVYIVLTDGFKLTTSEQELDEELTGANDIVTAHVEEETGKKTTRNTATAAANQNLPPGTVVDPNATAATQQPATVAQTVAPVRNDYPLTDPHNAEYAQVLLGGKPDEIKCTLKVQYLYDTKSDITNQ